MMMRWKGRSAVITACAVLLAVAAHAVSMTELVMDLTEHRTTPHYSIHFSKKPILDSDLTGAIWKDPKLLPVRSPTGEYYLCTLPTVETEKTDEEAAVEEVSAEALLKTLGSACILRSEGWWTYEVCFGKHARQYHLDKGSTTPSPDYLMGVNDPETSIISEHELESSPGSAYASVLYKDGTTCDLTGQPRSTELRFYCQPATVTHISSIKETSTCNYQVSITTPVLCEKKNFAGKTKRDFPIVCQQVMTKEEIVKYEALHAASQKETAPDPQTAVPPATTPFPYARADPKPAAGTAETPKETTTDTSKAVETESTGAEEMDASQLHILNRFRSMIKDLDPVALELVSSMVKELEQLDLHSLAEDLKDAGVDLHDDEEEEEEEEEAAPPRTEL